MEHRADRHRYELWVGPERAGICVYREPDAPPARTVFLHTEVDPAFGGRGLGGRLVRAALDDAIRRGRLIVPICPFVGQLVRGTSDYDEYVRWPAETGDE